MVLKWLLLFAWHIEHAVFLLLPYAAWIMISQCVKKEMMMIQKGVTSKQQQQQLLLLQLLLLLKIQ